MPVSGESKGFVKKLSGVVREFPAGRKIFTHLGIAFISSQTERRKKCSRRLLPLMPNGRTTTPRMPARALNFNCPRPPCSNKAVTKIQSCLR